MLVHAFSGKFEIFTILLRRENVFRDVLVEKPTFLRYKNVMLGKWQNLHLSMVLVEHLIFYVFFVGKIGRVKVWSTRFREKSSSFLSQNTRNSKIFFFANSEKKPIKGARDRAYCPLTFA